MQAHTQPCNYLRVDWVVHQQEDYVAIAHCTPRYTQHTPTQHTFVVRQQPILPAVQAAAAAAAAWWMSAGWVHTKLIYSTLLKDEQPVDTHPHTHTEAQAHTHTYIYTCTYTHTHTHTS